MLDGLVVCSSVGDAEVEACGLAGAADVSGCKGANVCEASPGLVDGLSIFSYNNINELSF